MPWILLPLLPLFTCFLAIADDLRVWPAYLLVPVAAWLGRRYGGRGVVTVALGAAAALLPTFWFGPFEFGGTPDLYVMAVWIAIAGAARDPVRALTGDSGMFRNTALLIVALIVLPLSLRLGTHQLEDGTQLSLWIGPRPLLLFALFLFGLAGLAPRHAVALPVATLAGIAIHYFGVDDAISNSVATSIDPEAPWVNAFRLRYDWDDLATLATGLVCFFAGNLVAQSRAGQQEQSALWRHPYLIVTLVTLLAALGTLTGQLLPRLPDVASLTGIHGDYFALPIAAFLAGFLLRHAGVAFCLGLFALLIAGSNAIAYALGQGGLSVAFEQPFLCLAYGMLGTGTRSLVDGVVVPFKAKRWVQYALLVAGIIGIVTSASELADFLTALLIAVVGALVAAGAEWLRRAMKRRGIQISGDGWLMLAVIVACVLWAVLSAGAIVSTGQALAEELDMTEGTALIVGIVLLHIPVALGAAGLSVCLPKVWSDVRALASRAKE